MKLRYVTIEELPKTVSYITDALGDTYLRIDENRIAFELKDHARFLSARVLVNLINSAKKLRDSMVDDLNAVGLQINDSVDVELHNIYDMKLGDEIPIDLDEWFKDSEIYENIQYLVWDKNDIQFLIKVLKYSLEID